MFKLKKIFLSTILLLFSISGFAQTIDEQIVKAENAASDSLKVIALNKLAAKNSTGDYKKAQEIVKKAFVYAGKKPLLQAECYRAEAHIHKENSKLPASINAYKQAITIYEKQNMHKEAAGVYEKLAAVYKKGKESQKAIDAYKQSILLAKKAGDLEQCRKSYKLAAEQYGHEGKSPEALALLLEQLSYARSLNPVNHNYVATANLAIAYNQFMAGNKKEALKYVEESYEHGKIKHEDYIMLDIYNTLGACHKSLNHTQEAIQWYNKSIEILEKSDKKKYLASVLVNTGIAYYEINENAKGLEYKKRALKLCEEINDHECMMNNFIATGIDLVEKDKNYEDGIYYLKQAEALSVENNELYSIQYINDGLYKAYSGIGDYKNAFDYLAKYLGNRDSILSTEKQKQMGEMEAKYESSKKQQQIELLGRNKRIQELQLLQNEADLDKEIAENKAKQNSILLLEKDKALKTASLRKKEAESAEQKIKLKLSEEKKRIAESESRNQRIVIYGFIAGLVLLVFLLVNIYRGYRQKKKANLEISQQKHEIELQKVLVEEKNKEITDSINYAKRLQEAILPPMRMVNEYLKNVFIFYKPKDIVAGDFYWMETIDNAGKNGKTVLLAAADCTGHGVPGAMVSVVCSNALNRAVKEFGLTEPGKILDKVRELVIETFDKSESEVKDGMDISLCAINLETNELLWSGANNPLWIMKKNAQEMIEIKADKQPIGKFIEARPFKTHQVKLEKDDTLYIFTDGYADQFGGPKGKKFKYSSLSKLLAEINQMQMNSQKERLEQILEDWQGDLEQVDDVCLIGIKI